MSNPYREWEPVLEKLSAAPGTTAVIGAVDSGKTTFCTLLLNRLLSNGFRVGIADLDLGQSEIGPPTTLGYSVLQSPVETLSEVVPQGLAFVGYHAPVRHVMLALTGACQVREALRKAQPEAIVIDTCGFVQGATARNFKLILMEVLRPDSIVALQRERELEPIIQALERREDWRVYRLPVPAVITRKSPLFRVQRRQAHFARYFANAQNHPIPLERVSLIGKRLGAGYELSKDQIERLERLSSAPILYAERSGYSLHLVTAQPLNQEQLRVIYRMFKSGRVTVTPSEMYQHLVVGLTDYAGRTFGIGILQGIDFQERVMRILSPVQSVEPIRWVHLGTLRLLPNGTELGEINAREA